MTAQIIHMDPEVEAAIRDGRLAHIEITEARMKLADGVHSLKARDLLPSKTKTSEEVQKAKTAKERQREFVKRKRDAGFKKDWLHHSIQDLAEQAGGQENIVTVIATLRVRAENAEQMVAAERKRADEAEEEVRRLQVRRWWQFWH